jgi:hypothetical protein
MGTVIEGKWKNDHQTHHRKMHDNLVECMLEYQEVIGSHPMVPKGDDGNVDWQRIPVSMMYQFFNMEAMKVNHEHTKDSIRPGRDTSDRGCDTESSE